MSRAILVISHEGSPWLKDCRASLIGAKYPVKVVEGGSAYDPAGFYYAVDNNLKEFVLLHDTMTIKDVKLFDQLFEIPGHVAFMPGFLSCLGKYVTAELPPLPQKPQNKREAVGFELGYANNLQGTVLFPTLTDTNVFEEKNGRNNMVIENEYLKKMKGAWSLDMIP